MTFKVGDKVITTKDHDERDNEVFPIGTVGIIQEIYCDTDTDTPYRVEAKSDYWWYSEDMLEPYEEDKGEVKQTKTTEVLRGERYDPSKADAMIGNVGEQIKVAYGWGYKDGNLDGQECGYPRGYNDAKREICLSGEYERAYQRGFEDGRQDAKEENGRAYDLGIEKLRNALIKVHKWDSDYLQSVFHGDDDTWGIVRDHTGQYIMDRVQDYEMEQALAATDKESEPINVGDEIVSDRGSIVVITAMGSQVGDWCCIDKYGCTCELKEETIKAHNWHKTGRHFDDIQGLLEKLQEK